MVLHIMADALFISVAILTVGSAIVALETRSDSRADGVGFLMKIAYCTYTSSPIVSLNP